MKLRGGLVGVGLAFGLSLGASQAVASIIAPIQVSQPIFAGEAGVVITTVTIMGHWPVLTQQDLEVRLTLAPSRVMDTTDTLRCENANAASIFGLRLELPNVDWEQASTETIHVALIVPPLDNRAIPSDWDFYADEVVRHTVQSILINARRRWPRIRAVRLELRGESKWKKYEGLHRLRNVVVPIRQLQLSEGLAE